MVVAGDSAVSDDDYRVVVQVFAWEGAQASTPSTPTATLDKVQNDDGLAKFNIAPILEDLFVPNDPRENSSTADAGDGLCYNLVLKIGYSNGGATTIDTTTSVIKVTSGYALYPDTINTFDGQSDYELSNEPLTEGPEDDRVFVKGQPCWFNVFWRGVSVANATGATFDGFDSSGSVLSQGVSFTTGGGTLPTDSSDFLVRQRMDSTYLDQTLGFDVDKEITCTINNGAGDDYVFTINFIEESCLIGSDCIGFVNRYGVWDWLHVYAAQRKGIKTNRIEYKSRVSYFDGSNEVDYDRYNPSNKILRTNAVETYSVITGWITESHNDLIRDMMSSKIWYGFNEGKALILRDQQVQYKNAHDEDLISYTFQFEVANSLIQDIQ